MGGQLLARSRRWRWASASKIGTAHLRSGTRKQDAFSVAMVPDGAMLAVVSDGAGSASHGGQGASLVCRSLRSSFRIWFTGNTQLPDDETILSWMDALRDRLAAVAERRNMTRRDFAATLAMLVVKDDVVLTLQVGDSAIVARRSGEWEALCWPESGEYASTTFFVTDDPDLRLHINRQPLAHDAFALFSDGIENVALEQTALRPHARFFDPMMKPVDQSSMAGRIGDLSAALGRYLESAALCERTDDDKTLILLSGT